MHVTGKIKPSGELIQQRKNIATGITADHINTTQVICTFHTHARGRILDTRIRPREETQLGYLRITKQAYGRKYKIEAGEINQNVEQFT